MLYINNSLYIIPAPPVLSSRSAILRAAPVSASSVVGGGGTGGGAEETADVPGIVFSSNSAAVHLMGSGSC